MVRREFRAIDEFPWQDWFRFERKRLGFTNRPELAKLANISYIRLGMWESKKDDKLDIDELSSVLEVIGFRFTVMCGTILDADFFDNAIRKGIRPPEEDTILIRGSVTNLRTFMYQIRRAKGVYAADFDRLFGLVPRTFHRYERDELNRIDFKLYLKALTYLDVSWQFVRGSVITHGDPEHFGIENFKKNEYSRKRIGPRKHF